MKSRFVGILVAFILGGRQLMTRATYGVLAGVIGSAIGFWLLNRRTAAPEHNDRGTVIFRNTPTVVGER
jgi:Na+/glutamate symporter